MNYEYKALFIPIPDLLINIRMVAGDIKPGCRGTVRDFEKNLGESQGISVKAVKITYIIFLTAISLPGISFFMLPSVS